jgi:hypothetical protein
MGKTLNINCGNAKILRYDGATFDSYDKIHLNAGNVVFSGAAYAELQKKQFSHNCGNMRVIDVTGDIRDLGRDAVIDGRGNYGGCFLVADGTLWVETADAAAFAGVTGVDAKRVYHPASLSLSAIPNLTANAVKAYPDGALLVKKNLVLTERAVRGWADDSVVWTPKELSAFDEKALENLSSRGIRLHCAKLYIYESLEKNYGKIFNSEKWEILPDGCEVVNDDIRLSSATFDEFGAKIYVRGDLTLAKSDENCLADFEFIRVDGDAILPTTAVRAFKKIGTAETLVAYRGTLWNITGADTINHAQLQTALSRGAEFTLQINGSVTFAEDITPEDLDCITQLNYNGAVVVPDALKPILMEKVGEGNGVMTVMSAKALMGFDTDEDASNINMGDFNLI